MMRLISLLCLLVLPIRSGWQSGGLQVAIGELQGVDVSHYQHVIAWDTVVARQSVEFAFVKATEGGDFIDTLFCRNWESLERLGIRRGAYHFFRAYGCGYDQALHFLQTVDMRPGDLAPVLDVETAEGMSKAVIQEEVGIWLRTVEQSLGIKPILYTNQNFYEKYLSGAFDQNPLWIARYSNERPLLSTGKRWDFWQYSNAGCVDGISQKVDLNIFPGTSSMLERLCWYPPAVGAQEASLSIP
ncbi:MAG: glycoside hydrolase family 25 protein [Saprospiraceae bacterium]